MKPTRVAAGAAALITSMALAGCAQGSGDTSAAAGTGNAGAGKAGTEKVVHWDTQPESVAHSDEIRHFNNLGQMVKSSDAVVEATVIDAQPGRWLGEPGADDSTRVRAVHLRVDRVLTKAPGATVPGDLQLEEQGYTSTGIGFQIDGVPWLQPGDHGIFVVGAAAEGSGVTLVNSQGRFLVTGDSLQPSGETNEPIFKAWHGKPAADLRQTIAPLTATGSAS